MKFSPSGDGILVEDGPTEDVKESGLVVPESAQNPYIYGTILKLGPGRRNESGERVPNDDYWVGQRVLYYRHGGQQMEVEGETFRRLVPADIIGVEGDDE